MHYIQFLDKLERREIPPVLFFGGEEEFLKEEALLRLDEILFPGESRVNKDIFEGKITAAGLTESLRTIPLLGRWRLVVVKGTKDMDEESRGTLASYLASPLNYIYLVIFLDREEDRNKWGSLSPKASLVEFKKFYEGDMAAWLMSRAKANNKSLSREVAGLFLECLGPDLALLSQGLQRAMDYIGAKGVIEAKDVEDIFESERKDIIFDLTAAMAAQDMPGCLRILNKLFLDLTPPQQIITRLAWQVRQLYTLKKGGDLKIPLFFLKRLRGEAQRCSLEKLEECLYRLREADRAIKSGEREPRLSLELFFFRFLS